MDLRIRTKTVDHIIEDHAAAVHNKVSILQNFKIKETRFSIKRSKNGSHSYGGDTQI